MPQKNPAEREVEIKLGKVEDNQTHYSNYMTVTATPYEFILTFGLLIPPEDVKGVSTLEAKPVSRILVPHEVFPEVVRALQDNLKRFQEKKQRLTREEK